MPETYFGEMVGVTRNINDTPQEVVLKIDSPTAPYIETKPLHSTQHTTARYEDGSIEVALNLIPNNELERLLLGFGSHIEVLSPPDLRANIATHFNAGNYIYSKNDSRK